MTKYDTVGSQLHKLAALRIPFSLRFDPQNDPYTGEPNPYVGDWLLEINDKPYEGNDPAAAIAFAMENINSQ